MIKIIVGSTSNIKVGAQVGASLILGLDFEIVAIDTESGVNAQPEGLIETHTGALNRATLAAKFAKKSDDTHCNLYAVGIENGIECLQCIWYDFACVVIIDPKGNMHHAISDYVRFPTDMVEEARKLGFTHHTVGSVLHTRRGYNPYDPHVGLTNGKRSRQRILEEVLIRAWRLALEENN